MPTGCVDSHLGLREYFARPDSRNIGAWSVRNTIEHHFTPRVRSLRLLQVRRGNPVWWLRRRTTKLQRSMIELPWVSALSSVRRRPPDPRDDVITQLLLTARLPPMFASSNRRGLSLFFGGAFCFPKQISTYHDRIITTTGAMFFAFLFVLGRGIPMLVLKGYAQMVTQ